MDNTFGLIARVIPMLLLAAFIGGFAWAGKFCKGGVARFFVGLLLGLGLILLVAGVAFAGCCVVVGTYHG